MCFASDFLWYILISLVYIFLEGREENYLNTAWGPVNSWHTPSLGQPAVRKGTFLEDLQVPTDLDAMQPFILFLLRWQVSMFAYCLNKPGGKRWEIQISYWSLNALFRYPENLKELWIIATKRPTESPLIVFGNKRGHFKYLCYGKLTKKAEEVS